MEHVHDNIESYFPEVLYSLSPFKALLNIKCARFLVNNYIIVVRPSFELDLKFLD